MKRFCSFLTLLIVLFCFAPLTNATAAKQMNADVPVWTEETVRAYAEDYIAGKEMSALYGYYDLQIRRYMPLSAYEAFLTNLEWMTGGFVEFGSYHAFAEPEKQLKTHVLHLCMERQDLDMYFTHKDKENDWEVMALQFVPADKQDRPSGLDLLVGDGQEETAAATVSYTETAVTVGAEGTPLEGILTLPKDAESEKVPACVLVHDRGALDKNHTMGSTAFFEDLAHTLASMGIASLRYDKRTFTYGDSEDGTVWEETVEDAVLAGAMVKANPAVDEKRVVLVGVGLGAMLAPRIVTEAKDVYTAMVLIGGTPKTLARLLLDETDQSGLSKEEVKALKTTVSGISKMTEAEAKAMTLFDRNGYYFWEMEQYDPIRMIKKLKMKTYIVQGKRDPVISEDDGWRAYSEDIGDGITYVSFKAFRSLNHILMNDLSTDEQGIPRYNAPTKLDQSAGRNISQWILSLYQIKDE